jgi:nucleoside-diphosphate-sugar epimerase
MIIVTGGSGQAGKACVKDLQEHGYDVVSVDLAPPVDAGVPFSRVDLKDFGQTMAALSAIDERVTKVTGIVHLAAIRAPGLAPNHVTFETNMLSTYNIFEASRQLGIKNIVWASSETVLGLHSQRPLLTCQSTKSIRAGPSRLTRFPNCWAKKWQSSSVAGIQSSKSSDFASQI